GKVQGPLVAVARARTLGHPHEAVLDGVVREEGRVDVVGHDVGRRHLRARVVEEVVARQALAGLGRGTEARVAKVADVARGVLAAAAADQRQAQRRGRELHGSTPSMVTAGRGSWAQSWGVASRLAPEKPLAAARKPKSASPLSWMQRANSGV